MSCLKTVSLIPGAQLEAALLIHPLLLDEHEVYCLLNQVKIIGLLFISQILLIFWNHGVFFKMHLSL